MSGLRLAAVQMAAGPDQANNLARATQWVQQAAAHGARVVALPELCLWRGRGSQYWDHAETVPGALSDTLAGLARRFQVFLVGGSLLERGTEGRCYNTSLLFSPSGEILARYRKIHLFDVALEGTGVVVRESDRILPGAEAVVVATEVGRLGLTICYDLRFPELFRALADQGAEILFLPAAFTQYTGRAHWQVLLRARAIENQAFVVAPALIGPMENGIPTFGHTMIVDPWGRSLARLGAEEGVAVADLNFAELQRIRRQLPALQHRRSDLFSLPARSGG
jgi:predicted amidohydrolase